MCASTPSRGRATLGLYNTYDRRRFAEAHRRALARAGALAFAFDWNLACFGFPIEQGAKAAGLEHPPETPVEVAEWIASTTTIGEEGAYYGDLAKAGRFAVFDLPDPGFPPQLGLPVATTRNAEAAKAATVATLARLLEEGQSLLLVFGLGPRGLPDEVLARLDRHLDVTGRGLSLETATAMGAVVGALSAILDETTGQPDRR